MPNLLLLLLNLLLLLLNWIYCMYFFCLRMYHDTLKGKVQTKFLASDCLGFHSMPEARPEASATLQLVPIEVVVHPSTASTEAGVTLGSDYRGDDATLAPARQKRRWRAGLALMLIAMVMRCAGVSYAAPSASSEFIITGDTTPSFPSAPTALDVNKRYVVLTLTNLVSGQYENGSVEWTATCLNAMDTSVQLYANGSPVGSADTSEPYGGTWVTGYEADTSVTLTARCIDENFRVGDSAGQAVSIDVTAPVISNLSAVAMTSTDMVLSYDVTEATSGVGHVMVLRCDPSPCTPSSWQATAENPYTMTGLGVSTIYDWQVQAVDSVGNVSTLPTKVTASLADLVAYFPLDSDGSDLSPLDNDCVITGGLL
jgi:hypothetical protein